MTSTALVLRDPNLAEPTLTGIQPISIKKTLLLVNSFVLNTTEFLNKFTSLCEQKLSRVSQQIQRTEIVLALLEAKLDSIEWLGGGPAPAPIAAAPGAPSAGVPAAPSMSAAPVAAAAPAPVAAAVPSQPKLRDDSRYGKYFKMLSMGVPKPAIKQKMASDGHDPDQIDRDPDAEAPEGGNSQALVVVSNGDSDSDKSDQMSDEDEEELEGN